MTDQTTSAADGAQTTDSTAGGDAADKLFGKTTDATKAAGADGKGADGKAADAAAEKGKEGAETSDANGDGKAAEVPEKYDLKLPEGMAIDQAMLDKVTPTLKELKLTNDQASKLATIYAEQAQAFVQQQQDAYAATQELWLGEIKADREIGGAKLEETSTLAGKAIAALTSDKNGNPDPAAQAALKKALEVTGAGNHPALARFFRRVGQLVSEDGGSVRASGAGVGKRAPEDVLYGGTTSSAASG